MSSNRDFGRYMKSNSPSIKGWKRTIHNYDQKIRPNSEAYCGWGRVLFANTFEEPKKLILELQKERSRERDIAFYVSDPHVVSYASPAEVFLDPSHTYRIHFESYTPAKRKNRSIQVRRLQGREDLNAVNAILESRRMVQLNPDRTLEISRSRKVINLVAECTKTKSILGFVTGIDHRLAFDDPERGSSLWSLAVDPKSNQSGVGEALVRYLIEHFHARGNSYLDLSVMHFNEGAIALYEKLYFERVPIYCVKLKNAVNESLFTAPKFRKVLNPYGQIIVDEAARRGIDVKVIDKAQSLFSLHLGGKSVVCKESLSDHTSATAMSACQDKGLTNRILKSAGIQVPRQFLDIENRSKLDDFLKKNRPVVVKPIDGEQGQLVKVGLKTKKEIFEAVNALAGAGVQPVVEQMVSGSDIRVLVINSEVVAVAERRPPLIVGDGVSTIETLIKRLNRRKSAASQGESQIPVDQECERVLKDQKLHLESILPNGKEARVRNTANFHTGGTIHDITSEFPDRLKEVAIRASEALQIPVVGLDFMIPNLGGQRYWIIEANERPGLANHEPQPTAQKFLDFLFPTSARGGVS
ncbi:MAG: N-acetylglutaminylglutamine synthetase [Bdellovibrionales bacterium]|nr:N-acetylglutaminylglutamine synthetase [Bdellovibrionales bacterium]